jgi:hypothetical protein
MPGKRFHKVHDAKEFLASKIANEAEREGAPSFPSRAQNAVLLRSGLDSPGYDAASDEFDREYNQNDSENKVSSLIENLDKRLRKENRAQYEDRLSAIRFLRRKDHYINVMIGQAELRPRGDRLKLWVTGLAVAVGLLLVMAIADKYTLHLGHHRRGRPVLAWDDSHDVFMWMWLAAFVSACLYLILRWILGEKRLNELTASVLCAIFKSRKRAGA